jgi:hypothetical protein
MLALTQVVRTFPSARVQSRSNALPVDVALIAQLSHGAGDQLFESVIARQQAHNDFVDELDEPSARLGGVDLAKGDATSLYSFAVGAKGHPFHRHAGHRMFTAISGSGGAQLRFADASREQIERDARSFIRSMRYINIPPDSLFTVRFGGDTWHQFAPLEEHSRHPAFFALSCHTNELGGALPESVRARVMANEATIPSLTELLPQAVADLLKSAALDPARVPTIALSLDAPAGSLQAMLCKLVRGAAGKVRSAWSRWRDPKGFLSDNGGGRPVVELSAPPSGSTLLKQLPGFQHEDTFSLTVVSEELRGHSASAWLAAMLDGFLQNPPSGVSKLMALRNLLVKPLGLRTSPLGCPVSSLLCRQSDALFAGCYPVIEQAINAEDIRAQVILGADDKHLLFRSCAGVDIRDDGCIVFTLGTRVQCKNLFCRLYMAAIDKVHRAYITPTILRMAVDHAITANRAA